VIELLNRHSNQPKFVLGQVNRRGRFGKFRRMPREICTPNWRTYVNTLVGNIAGVSVVHFHSTCGEELEWYILGFIASSRNQIPAHRLVLRIFSRC